ncbi:baseplate J/gp47 family protein [Candidatus Saccharibacteria bacterium]|nr:baseplate J/gp47 family protein [Candidatus Saccharibacteria bacterium]
MAFGVIPTGFGQKSFEEIKAEIEQAQLDSISPGLNHSTQSVLTRLNVIYGDKAAELWEVANAIYSNINPNTAIGDALDALAAITGVTRLPQARSTVSVDFTFSAGTVIVPAGTIVSVSGSPDIRFQTKIVFVSPGAGTYAVSMEAAEYGPIDAAIGSLTVLESPITGLTSVSNPAKPTLGRLTETDAELRIRRRDLLSLLGGSTLDAIKSDVASVEGVVEVAGFENDTDATVDSIPPHAFEIVVDGGDDNDIAQAIHDTKPAGIASTSTSADSGTAVDSEGMSHTIDFTRPTLINIYIDVSVTTDPETYAGDLAVQEAIRDFFLTFKIGADVILSKICVPVFSVSGVLDVTVTEAGTSPSPSGTANIVIAKRDRAVIDDYLTDIVVTSS